MTNFQGTAQALSEFEKQTLFDIISRLRSNPSTVDSGQLATARNLSARAGLSRTKIALDHEIHRRGEGAQDPDALLVETSGAKAPSPVSEDAPEKKPIWPLFAGFALVIGSLSYLGRKGQREIHARIERQRHL